MRDVNASESPASDAPPSPPQVPQPTGASAPGLMRRMASFTYEGVILFGVVMIAGYLYSTLTQQRHALQGQWGLRAFLFLVLGIYFVWFWSRGGQTVAMKAWHVRLVDSQGRAVSQARALCRYLLSWLWFFPALATAWVANLSSSAEIFGLMAVGVVAYALLARLHPQQQFWHDAVCGTRLIDWRPALPPKRKRGASKDSDPGQPSAAPSEPKQAGSTPP
ncbi:MAG: RDD family protein [Betaproteobacteria bacterium]|nr:RDD family protein [Betaproteobacteria bacterium]